MGTILPRNYIIAILVLSIFIMGGTTILGKFRNYDPSFGNNSDFKLDDFNSTFNRLDNISDSSQVMEDSIVNATAEEGTLGTLNSLIKGAWNSVKMIFTSFGFMATVFGGISTFFGIPTWIPGMIITMISIMLVFSILSAILQRDI